VVVNVISPAAGTPDDTESGEALTAETTTSAALEDDGEELTMLTLTEEVEELGIPAIVDGEGLVGVVDVATGAGLAPPPGTKGKLLDPTKGGDVFVVVNGTAAAAVCVDMLDEVPLLPAPSAARNPDGCGPLELAMDVFETCSDANAAEAALSCAGLTGGILES
jgi:hypothetical protein